MTSYSRVTKTYSITDTPTDLILRDDFGKALNVTYPRFPADKIVAGEEIYVNQIFHKVIILKTGTGIVYLNFETDMDDTLTLNGVTDGTTTQAFINLPQLYDIPSGYKRIRIYTLAGGLATINISLLAV